MTPVIKTVLEVLEFGEQYNYFAVNDYKIRINYMNSIKTIISNLGIPESLLMSVYDVLAQLHKPQNWSHIKDELLKMGLSRETVNRLEAFDKSFNIGMIRKRAKLGFELDEEVVSKLELLVSNLEHLGVKNEITFDPLLIHSPNVFSHDIVFQISRISKSKHDVFAAGGRYERILSHFRHRGKDEGGVSLHAVGVNIAFSKLVSVLGKQHMRNRDGDSKAAKENCHKAKVIISSIGNGTVLTKAKLSLASELWTNNISAELSLGALSALDFTNLKYGMLRLNRFQLFRDHQAQR
jgi:histidyl-tRNA synthetase